VFFAFQEQVMTNAMSLDRRDAGLRSADWRWD
jgi:hypothetical protein